MSDFNVNDLFVKTAQEVVVTGGERKVVFIPKGTIKVYPIYRKDDPSPPISTGVDSFGRTKYGMWVLVASDGGHGDKMPEGYETRILPIILPASAVQALTEILQQKDDDTGENLYALTVVEGDKVTQQGDLYSISRTGTTKTDTKYSVLPSRASKSQAFPSDFTVPENTLAEAMADYSQWQETQAQGSNNEETEDTPTDENASSLF